MQEISHRVGQMVTVQIHLVIAWNWGNDIDVAFLVFQREGLVIWKGHGSSAQSYKWWMNFNTFQLTNTAFQNHSVSNNSFIIKEDGQRLVRNWPINKQRGEVVKSPTRLVRHCDLEFNILATIQWELKSTTTLEVSLKSEQGIYWIIKFCRQGARSKSLRQGYQWDEA
jgi:hypothetical protein